MSKANEGGELSPDIGRNEQRNEQRTTNQVVVGGRKPGTTACHQAMLTQYMHLGPGRTLAKLAKIECECGEAHNVRTLEYWSSSGAWGEQTARYDEHLSDLEREQNTREMARERIRRRMRRLEDFGHVREIAVANLLSPEGSPKDIVPDREFDPDLKDSTISVSVYRAVVGSLKVVATEERADLGEDTQAGRAQLESVSRQYLGVVIEEV